jgi:hypothetical protein
MLAHQYSSEGGKGLVEHAPLGAENYGGLYFGYYYQPLGDAALRRAIELDIPQGSLVRGVRARVRARAPGTVQLDTVAEVRAAGSGGQGFADEVIADFKGLRTIAAVGRKDSTALSSTGVTYEAWNGSEFAPNYYRSNSLDEFEETATERLRFTFGSSVSVSAVGTDWTVTLPTPPQTVDLTVNGGRVWSGGVATPTEPGSEYDVDTVIDLTAAVSAAVTSGQRVLVELASSSPAELELTIVDEDVLFVHDVGFPEGAVRRITRDAEGPFVLDLPLDGLAGAASVQVPRVEWTVTAETDEQRRRPAIGPVASPDATLALSPERTTIARLPATLLAPFAELSGVRLLVAADSDAEIGCELLADATTDPSVPVPGEPIADAPFEPLTLGPAAGATWWSVVLSEPFELVGGALWLAVRLVRGTATWQLAPGGAIETDRPLLRWRAPSGTYRPLSQPGGLPELDAALRVIGTPHPESPIGSLAANLATRPAAAVTASPPRAGQRFVIDLGDDAVDAGSMGLGSSPAIRLELVNTAPGTFAFERSRVFYEPAGSVVVGVAAGGST